LPGDDTAPAGGDRGELNPIEVDRVNCERRTQAHEVVFTATDAQLFLGLMLGLHRLEAFHPAATTPPRSTLFLGSPWDMHWTKSQRGHTPERGHGVDHAHL
jgi:hypothetical protein